ncbi:hypothetical protein RUM44_002018 [Polyplax serrata]|uniref:N-acetyltransferase domain-containing protein n=1 Tax=Polyplax serrata TaxID=468196 RepID=A0ABR1ALP4_POLSC
MAEEDQFVVIRVYQKHDEKECFQLLREGVMSTVQPSFLTALTREVTFQIIITMAAVMFVFIGLSPTICILSIPATVVVIYVSVYIAHVKRASALAFDASDIEKTFLSSKYTCFWVAELYEISSPHKCSKQQNIAIIQQAQLDAILLDDKIYKKKIIGIVGVNRCDVMYESAWIRRMTINSKYQQMGIGPALLNEAINFCKNKGYQSIEVVTSECQDGARKLYLQKGFKLRQLYHKSILGPLVQVLMYQFTLAIPTNNAEKKVE